MLFRSLGETFADRVVMVIGEAQGRMIAGALNLLGSETLFGRNWGADGDYRFLHFEACYYQAIEYAIAHRLAAFEGGAQGEHKLSRGFLPVETWSAHWLRHPRFADAIGAFLAREGRGIEHYIDELNDRSPFKQQA